MGHLQIWPSLPDGFCIEDNLFPPPSLSSPSPNPDPVSIDSECWVRAEETVKEIINRIQPTVMSEQRRKVVIEYVQRLIGTYLGCEVFPFGSVPLKTYLPDGDIDLTALSIQNVEDALANDVRNVLEGEEQNKAAEFEVKDVQYIHAEVKLVKCLVQNIVVDISFNQMGGLCTLCFLEQVDRRIGKDHLFKRSIILIKSWCYYESRILGAHHGLISTYALETLVLYIFHLFHSSLNGPLAVLYRFLDYYSKFDWDNYCISLNGPVNVALLPEIVAETPENGGGELLLTKEFLRECLDRFSVPSKGLETNIRAFPQKYLNIVDPLKENNNLGRSVSKGNFFRIRSAFSYGARKLGRILLLPGEIHDELKNFFGNTLDRHGSGERPDLQDPIPTSGVYGSELASTMSSVERFNQSERVSVSRTTIPSQIEGESMVDLHGLLSNKIKDMKIAGVERNPAICVPNEAETCTNKAPAVLEMDDFADGNIVSRCRHLVADANDNSRPKSTSASSEFCTLPPERALDASRHFSSRTTFSKNSKIENGYQGLIKPTYSGIVENRGLDESNVSIYSCCHRENPIALAGRGGDIRASNYFCNGSRELEALETDGNPTAAPNALSELAGDYENHFKRLQFAKWYHDYGCWGSVMPLAPPPPSQFLKHGWETDIYRAMPLNRNTVPHMNPNNVISGLQFYSANPPMVSGASSFGADGMQKPRGTGTYIPNTTNYSSYNMERSFPGKERNSTPADHGLFPRSPCENGWVNAPPSETNLLEKSSSLEQPQRNLSVLLGQGKRGPLEVFQNGPAMRGLLPYSNGLSIPDKPEFGTYRHLPLPTPAPDLSRQPQPPSSAPQTPVSTAPMERPRPSLTIDAEKVSIQSYHLKEDDFPPLSV